MAKGFLEAAVFAIIVMAGASSVYAGDTKSREGGLFSEGSFLSDAISSATDKLSKVGSGDERIVDQNARGLPEGVMEYGSDPFQRGGTGFTREDYRRNRDMSKD